MNTAFCLMTCWSGKHKSATILEGLLGEALEGAGLVSLKETGQAALQQPHPKWEGTDGLWNSSCVAAG